MPQHRRPAVLMVLRRPIAALILATAFAAGAIGTIGAKPAGAIVSGSTVITNDYQFVAEIDYATSTLIGPGCTGSLIHPSWVLTAVHCVDTGVMPTQVSVRIGNRQLGKGGDVRKVAAILRNPAYNGTMDDVALLRLERPSNYPRVRLGTPAESAYSDGVKSPGPDYATAVGWGYTQAGGPFMAPNLQYANATIAPDPTTLTDGPLRIDLDWTVANGRGPCQGDSGGPLLVSTPSGRSQVGVMKGANCSGGGNYSQVDSGPNRTWIRKQIPDLDNPAITPPSFVYAEQPNGDLLCYRHNGFMTGLGINDGGANWQYGSTVGNGWQGFTQVFSASGAIYGLKADGTLWWYRHDGFNNCAGLTTPGSWQGGTQVLSGLSGMRLIPMTSTTDPAGVIYAIDAAGQLWWYRHNGYANGTPSTTPGAWDGPKLVGTGWNIYTKVFAGENGVMYGIDGAGQLWWYRHYGWTNGAGLETPGAWTGRQSVGGGWNTYSKILSTGDGVIYGIDAAGNLNWYRHNSYLLGGGPSIPGAWSGPYTVGTGWQNFTQVFVRSPSPYRGP